MDRVLAAALLGRGDMVVENVPTPVLTGPGQVLVHNIVSTICGSDIHIIAHGHESAAGARPGFPGHESVGRVTTSSDPAFSEGDLVLAVPNLKHAGGFAEYQLLPSTFVLPLPADAVPETTVLAQQLGTVIYAMKRFWPTRAAGVDRSATAVVLGAGPVGLFFTRLCRLAGFSSVITADLHEHRLKAAREMGATLTVRAVGDEIVEVVQANTDDGAELVIEAAGTDVTRVQAIHCVALEGRIGMFGMPAGTEMTVPFERLFRRKPTVEFCYDAQAEPGHSSFKEALQAIASGTVDVAPLQTKLWPLAELPHVLELVVQGAPGLVKAGVRFP